MGNEQEAKVWTDENVHTHGLLRGSVRRSVGGQLASVAFLGAAGMLRDRPQSPLALLVPRFNLRL